MWIGLIQIGVLLGLSAVTIPIVIHLIFRQRPRTVELGSIRFLREILERSRGRRQIMRWLLMSLRIAAVALLSLLFARPYLTEAARADGDRMAAILIDRSASMQLTKDGRTLFAEAVDRARKLINDSPKTLFEIAYFDHHVTPRGVSFQLANSGGVSFQLARNQDRLEAYPTFGGTNYSAAMAWARDVCTKSTAEFKELHVLTDMRRSGLHSMETPSLPRDVRLQVHDVGRDVAHNVTVIKSTVSRTLVRPDEPVVVDVGIRNSGSYFLDDVAVLLSLNGDGSPVRLRQKVKLAPTATSEVRFELTPPLAEGLWQGTVSVDLVDDLPWDNQRQLAVMVAQPYDVLLVDGAPSLSPYQSESYFLEAALRLALPGQTDSTISPYRPQVIRRPDELPDLTEFNAVVLANVGELSDDEVGRLKRFVRGGGGLLIFSGDQVTAASGKSLIDAGLVPGTIVGPKTSQDLPWRITNTNDKHSIFQLFSDPQYGNLHRIAFRGYTEIRLGTGWQILAELSSGVPLVVERQLDGGNVVWFLSTCGPEWNNGCRTPLFLPLVHQILGWQTGLNEGGPVREVEIGSANDDRVDLAPGVYSRGRYWEVVNTSPSESETDRCSPKEFAARFNTEIEEAATPSRDVLAGSIEIRNNEIWHWVLFLAATILGFEFFVANRTVG
jgi:uncharacterized membrane protein